MRFFVIATMLATSLLAGRPDWQLGVQAYTFRKFTVADAAAKSEALGLRVIELYPGQKLGGGLKGTSNYTMDAETREGLKQLLRAHRLRISAYGVCTPGKAEDWTKLFDFAKDMGIPILVSEPAPDQLDLVEKLADQYAINVAFHNHAQPSRYWNPETVLAATKDRSPRLGACVDVGHWLRSGLDPVTGLQQLEGRIVSLHIKDMSAKAKNAHCVPLGTGALDVAGVLAELKRQDFEGPFSIEYEYDWDHPYPGVRQCVVWFNEASAMSAADLLAGKAPKGAFVKDVTQVWAAPEPGYDGLWPKVESADTKGYKDLTDDAKGTLKACGDGFPKEHYPNAFDNNPNTKWCIKSTETWIEYHFPEGTKGTISAYTITSANDAPDRDPKEWKFLGSNDGGKTWQAIDEQKNQKWYGRFQKRVFKLDKEVGYSSYRLDMKNSGNPESSQLAEIELLAKTAE
jgi:sugar phosphate isomerase/epimerase